MSGEVCAYEYSGRDLDEVRSLAAWFREGGFYPHLRSEGAFVTIFAKGAAYGLTPIQALDAFDIIEGRPAIRAQALAAIVLASPVCRRFRCVESTAERCVYEAARKGEDPVSVEVTMEMARTAGWCAGANGATKKNWRMPEVMLQHRCEARAARLVFPDVTLGLYTIEEMVDSRESRPVSVEIDRDAHSSADARLQGLLEASLSVGGADGDTGADTPLPDAAGRGDDGVDAASGDTADPHAELRAIAELICDIIGAREVAWVAWSAELGRISDMSVAQAKASIPKAQSLHRRIVQWGRCRDLHADLRELSAGGAKIPDLYEPVRLRVGELKALERELTTRLAEVR